MFGHKRVHYRTIYNGRESVEVDITITVGPQPNELLCGASSRPVDRSRKAPVSSTEAGRIAKNFGLIPSQIGASQNPIWPDVDRLWFRQHELTQA
jgi:hypothetical protein